MTLKQLQAQEAEALRDKVVAQRALNTRKSELKEQHRIIIAEQLASEGLTTAVEESTRQYNTAVQAVQVEMDRLAKSGEGALFPIGTLFVEVQTSRSYHTHPVDHVPTGRTGIYELITQDSPHPDNAASYSRSSLGASVIRLLKKDGTPSKKYIPLYRDGQFPHGWKLEKPNAPVVSVKASRGSAA